MYPRIILLTMIMKLTRLRLTILNGGDWGTVLGSSCTFLFSSTMLCVSIFAASPWSFGQENSCRNTVGNGNGNENVCFTLLTKLWMPNKSAPNQNVGQSCAGKLDICGAKPLVLSDVESKQKEKGTDGLRYGQRPVASLCQKEKSNVYGREFCGHRLLPLRQET
jgi:hypothetical protein